MYKKTYESAFGPTIWKRLRYLMASNQRDWGRFFGVSDRIVRRWESGITTPPKMADRVLECMCKDDRVRLRLADDPALYLALSEKGLA